MIYYTKFNAYEILDGGDNMVMVGGVVVDSVEKAEKVCHLIDAKKIENERKNQNEIWYCSLAD